MDDGLMRMVVDRWMRMVVDENGGGWNGGGWMRMVEVDG